MDTKLPIDTDKDQGEPQPSRYEAFFRSVEAELGTAPGDVKVMDRFFRVSQRTRKSDPTRASNNYCNGFDHGRYWKHRASTCYARAGYKDRNIFFVRHKFGRQKYLC